MRNYPRVYTSFMPNAPTLTGVPGSLLDIIKKCLNGGWTPFDVTGITVSAGIATFTFNYPDASLPDYCILNFSGCDEPLLNKEFTIIKGYDNRGQFKTTVADGTYGGSIKATPAPAGWDLLFSGTNQAVIRSSNENSSRVVVQITDTNATTASFNFASDATSVTALIDNVKTTLNYEWAAVKSRNADATNIRGWHIIADNTTVYFLIDLFSYGSNIPLKRAGLLRGRMYFFGDYISNDPQENENFSAWFQAVAVGAVDNNTAYNDASPFTSGVWTENYTYARPLIKTSLFRFTKWNWGVFVAAQNVANQTWRISGTTSNLCLNFANDLEKSYRTLGVLSRSAGGTAAITPLGVLPGIRYSDYFIRTMFSPFTSSEDKDTGDTFVYIPISQTTTDNNNYEITQGYSPFRMNKKWDE